MRTTFRHAGNFYRVTVTVDPEMSPALIEAAVALGAQRAYIVKARGVLHKKKVGVLSLPGFSPSFDILHLIVPRASLYAMLNALVRVGKLDHFGAGAIYATRIHDLWFSETTLFAGPKGSAAARPEFDFQNNLVAVSCICQLDHAEEIAHRAMAAGSPSPTICYGYGHGIRDRLGFFLQLTINPKKEFIELVVGSAESDRIFHEMVSAGRLDEPAMGFIFTQPVDIGLINTMSFQNTTPYAATMEQVIKAIDEIKGNTRWRSTGIVKGSTGKKRKVLTGLVSLNCIVNRGFGDACSMVAMEAGAGGTSTYYANASPMETRSADGFGASDEREIVSLTISQAQVRPVVNALTSMSEIKGTPAILFAYPAPQALTYLK